MAFTQVPIVGEFDAPGGGAATGRITFRPTSIMRNGVVTAPSMVTAYLMAGEVPAGFTLAATDDVGTTPVSAKYQVTEYIDGAAVRTYLIKVPSAAVSIDLGTVATEPIVTGTYQLVAEKGTANGYASLDATGKVPTAQLPSGSGGGATDHGALTGLADDDHTQYLTQARGDARYYTETESNSLLAAKADSSTLTSHTGNTSNPHSVTKTQVGLGNVDNTADSVKPISSATQAALDAKQPLDADLTTIAGLTATTDNFLVAVANAWASRTPAQVKTTLALNNVDNTSDAGKPVSTATQTALNLKAALTVTDALDARLDILEIPSIALTDATTIAVNAALGNKFKVTLGGNRTLGNPTGAYDGQLLIFNVLQDATGSRTVTLGNKYRLASGVTLTWSTTANMKDKLLVQYDSVADKFDVLAFQPGYGA